MDQLPRTRGLIHRLTSTTLTNEGTIPIVKASSHGDWPQDSHRLAVTDTKILCTPTVPRRRLTALLPFRTRRLNHPTAWQHNRAASSRKFESTSAPLLFVLTVVHDNLIAPRRRCGLSIFKQSSHTQVRHHLDLHLPFLLHHFVLLFVFLGAARPLGTSLIFVSLSGSLRR